MPQTTKTELTPYEILKQARELITNPAHWCRSWYWMDKDHRLLDTPGPTCVQRCVTGALIEASIPLHFPRWSLSDIPDSVYEYLGDALGIENRDEIHLVAINDNEGHTRVLEVLDSAMDYALSDMEAAGEDFDL